MIMKLCGGGVKQNLNKVKWSVFYISDYFDFIRGNQNNMAKCETGNIPLISAKKVDNGYKDFIKSNGKKLFPKHILTLNNDGDGGVGLAYYQPVESALDTHVTALVPKLDLSKYALLFVSRCISHQREKFSHGYSLNNQRLHSQKIMLPENMDGQPSWVYMSNYMQQIELQQIMHYLSYQAR
ncbi:restriction endonuclease subunit S [Actinobacillus pleuropneumoniae]|nr:restriction endonuclease subunit S [Actinobacillus pleuropneumoniae]